MPNLTAVFELVDRISDKLDSIANRGSGVADAMENIGSNADSSFGNAVSAADGAAVAIGDLKNAMDAGAAAIEDFRSNNEALEAELTQLQDAYMGVVLTQGEDTEAAKTLKQAISDQTYVIEQNQKQLKQLEEQAGKTGKESVDAIQEVEKALASAGILKAVNDITDGVYELVTAFSEAESTIVKATGATGAALNDLDASMMKAFSQSKTGSMADTAAAVGEINTRMGLVGEELTDVTGKFLDFSAITGTDVVGSVQGVTKVMSRWNVEGKDLESVLDKLAFAGQKSGISVSSLQSTLQTGAATFQQFDFTLDNTISMLSDFELAGINSSSVLMGLKTAAKNFADEGLNAHDALIDTIKALEKMDDEAEATSLAVKTFGTRAGLELASAIRSGKLSVDTFTASLDEADGTLKKTAEAAQTLDQKWEQATGKIQAAFTKAVEPTLNKLSDGMANAVGSVGDFLSEHQDLTKIITALGTGLGVAAAGIAAVASAATIAKVAVKLFGTEAALATLKIGAIVAAIAALGAAIALFADGSHAYEAENQAIDEIGKKLDGLVERHKEVYDSFEKTNKEIDTQYESSHTLIEKLKELDSAAEKTSGTEAEMKAIVERLTEAYPQLGLTIDNVSGNLDTVIAKFEQAANSESKFAKYENARANYTKFTEQTEALKNALDEAQAAYDTAYNNMTNRSFFGAIQDYSFVGALSGKSGETKTLENARYQLDRAREAYNQNQNAIAQCQKTLEEYNDMVNGTSEEQIDAYTAVREALGNVKDASEELLNAYNSAYQSAYDSISGQIGLFDQMAISCETSTDQMIAALKSQSDYIATYTENLKTAAEIGLNEGLIAALSDGSDESAGYLDAIISKVEELGGTTDEAKAFIDEMNSSFADVETAKDEFATTVADMQTNFDEEMAKISQTLEDTITKMNMDEEAAEAARETLEAYVQMIESYKGKAGDAAAQVAEAASSALMIALWRGDSSSGDTTFVGDGSVRDFKILDQMYGPQPLDLTRPPVVPAHATGSTNAEDVFIAGEQGPELVVGKGGSTVFPQEETDRIIQAIGDRDIYVTPSEYSQQSGGGNGGTEATQKSERKITLEIAGSGSLNVGGGVSKETVIEWISENIKPKLLEIVQSEILEEGDLSYDY